MGKVKMKCLKEVIGERVVLAREWLIIGYLAGKCAMLEEPICVVDGSM
jgi:hypothetical protein